MDVFYNPAYVGSAHAFETTRKARWIAESLSAAPLEGLRLVEPRPLGFDEVAAVHDAAYVRAVQLGKPRELAESQGFAWDEGLWPMVLASNGGVVAAALGAMEQGTAGSLSSGLHHARRDIGAGFCTFNGLVLAAQDALGTGARAVLILDLDAHCGGGTASLIREDTRVWQRDVSVSGYDFYASTERMHLTMVRRAEDYLAAVEKTLHDVARIDPGFSLCLYNAGMDPFERCGTGGLKGITRDLLAARERMVFARCRKRELPVAFVLAGGYLGAGLDEAGIVELHRLTLSAALGFAP
jgi:acetoin utilization deacetylase AcuC-like enzyme